MLNALASLGPPCLADSAPLYESPPRSTSAEPCKAGRLSLETAVTVNSSAICAARGTCPSADGRRPHRSAATYTALPNVVFVVVRNMTKVRMKVLRHG